MFQRDQTKRRWAPAEPATLRGSTAVIVGAGSVGAGDRLNYTVHGDPVNLAARLESLNKEFEAFLDMQGLDPSIKLPMINRTRKTARTRLRIKATPEAIERLVRIYRDDFEQFGYSMEEASLL